MRYQKFLAVVVFIVCSFSAIGQTTDIDALQKEIIAAENEIKKTNEILKQNKNNQQNRLSQLGLVNSTIRNRKSIISNIDKQVGIINKNISKNNSNVKSLNSNLDAIKKEYSTMMVNGYKNYRLNNFFLLLFSATNFHDVCIKLYYIKQYSNMQEIKAKQIEESSTTIKKETTSLKEKQNDLKNKLDDKTKEVGMLDEEKGEYQRILTSLKNEEGNLSEKIRSHQKLINNLQKKIAEIIEEEARKMKGSKRSESEEAHLVKLSGSFEECIGKLPSPLRGGVVTDHFGIHEHHLQKGLQVNNKGINITAENNANVTAVFEGVISKIFFFQGLNNSVMIRHGNYITVYSNLSEVFVSVGEKVKIQQKIGTVKSSNENNASLHFEIWKETTNLNPELWITQK